MRLILNGINDEYLRNITENSADDTEEVLAAVAYATDARLLFDWCLENDIPLTYYGRLDARIAVSINILNNFLNKRSADFVCKLVKHHHAKVIWWRGFGLYIGSANLTTSAWYNNIEAGCFFPAEEIDDVMANNILNLFRTLEENSTPLTKEAMNEIQKHSKILERNMSDEKEFWQSPSFINWDGLAYIGTKKADDRKREEFLKEWHDTLQELRNIGERVSEEKNRPSWVDPDTPAGAQADQFLHAHYYQRTFDGRRSNYKHFYEKNRSRKEKALEEAIAWWKNLPPLDKESETLNVNVPFLRSALSREVLLKMDEDAFHDICKRIYAIRTYARRVPNKKVNLPDDTQYNRSQKIEALAKWIWNNRFSEGERVKRLLDYILYSGSDEKLPERLWQGFTDSGWKIDGLGISSLGEIVGWALPDRFPPRNGRTSKSLKSLGYDVTIHGEEKDEKEEY